jgi:hypothetical protein
MRLLRVGSQLSRQAKQDRLGCYCLSCWDCGWLLSTAPTKDVPPWHGGVVHWQGSSWFLGSDLLITKQICRIARASPCSSALSSGMSAMNSSSWQMRCLPACPHLLGSFPQPQLPSGNSVDGAFPARWAIPVPMCEGRIGPVFELSSASDLLVSRPCLGRSALCGRRR